MYRTSAGMYRKNPKHKGASRVARPTGLAIEIYNYLAETKPYPRLKPKTITSSIWVNRIIVLKDQFNCDIRFFGKHVGYALVGEFDENGKYVDYVADAVIKDNYLPKK